MLLVLTMAHMSACQLTPAFGMTCDGVPPGVCELAFEEVRNLFERTDEVVESASVSPTGRVDCLHEDVPLADVVVRLEGKPDPVLLTVGRTLDGEASICF